ncbi:hypothetical protein [Clostridium paridis]|uniref:Uncharacterized protein n=1 Tax=Clostridium paridis TaxID=2803863 RepID=A0A937FFS0_9CLOT|nr:hypothetical protein [Clostridium paridis]MBL4931188.1 hypothetical protein [Clostridium paridis]
MRHCLKRCVCLKRYTCSVDDGNRPDYTLPCDGAGTIQVTSIIGDQGAPIGTGNLKNIHKYITAAGAVITWVGNIILVCEHIKIANVWSVYALPFKVEDGLGIVQNILYPNSMFTLKAGDKLIIGIDKYGNITRVRYILPKVEIKDEVIEGFDPKQIAVYYNTLEGSKVFVDTLYNIMNKKIDYKIIKC